MLNLAAKLRGGAAKSDLGWGTDGGVGERVQLWSGEVMEWVEFGRLRKMDGENVSSLLLEPEDFSLECGDKNPESTECPCAVADSSPLDKYAVL